MAARKWTPLSAAALCKKRIRALQAKAQENLLACSREWSDEDGFLEREFEELFRDMDDRLRALEAAMYDVVEERTFTRIGAARG